MARQVGRGLGRRGRLVALTVMALLVVVVSPGSVGAQEEPDPRVGLGSGWLDAETAIRNLEHVAHHDKPRGSSIPPTPAASPS